jgi:hypothetical protein
MFLLSGIVLTASPASAASTETVPYTYTVKVPVTKTVWEYEVVKTKIGNRTVYTYQKVAKTKTEYRIETRTGYREAPVKAADKPAAAQYKVQIAPTAAFTNVTKEILVTPSAPGTNKVNLSSQLSGSVGDTTFIRVVAKNAAGKSTPGKVAKLAFGEVSRSNYDVQVPYTETGTRVSQNAFYYTVDVPYTAYGTRLVNAGYWYTNYNSPTYTDVWTQTGGGRWETYQTGGGYSEYRQTGGDTYIYVQTGGGYHTWGVTSPAYSGSYYVSGYREYYDCSYWSQSTRRWIDRTCNYWVSGYYEYYDVPATYGLIYVAPTYGYEYVPPTYAWVWVDATYADRWVAPTYGWVSTHTGYNSAYAEPTYETYAYTAYSTETRFSPAQYENYSYTAYRTETRVAITNGWKAATN